MFLFDLADTSLIILLLLLLYLLPTLLKIRKEEANDSLLSKNAQLAPSKFFVDWPVFLDNDGHTHRSRRTHRTKIDDEEEQQDR